MKDCPLRYKQKGKMVDYCIGEGIVCDYLGKYKHSVDVDGTTRDYYHCLFSLKLERI